MNIYIPLKTIIDQNNYIEMCRIQTKSQRHHQEQAVRTQGPSISTSIQYLCDDYIVRVRPQGG